MECDQCGARRPRSGPCPECGAPPPGTYSSLSQWKSRSRDDQNDEPRRTRGPDASNLRGTRGPGDSTRRGGSGRGTSGASYGSGRGTSGASYGSGRGTSGARWGTENDSGWDEDARAPYDDGRAAGRSGGNRRRGADQYDEVDLERALVPTRNDMMPMDPMAAGAGLPALPGIPATEEEERALGIRRPVYIPPTSEKRTRKLGTWRVMSGVLSVMLVCVASCGLLGLVGRDRVLTLLPHPITVHMTPSPNALLKYVPETPVATAGPTANIVQSAITAHGVDVNKNPIDVSSHFLVNSDVYVVVAIRNITDGKPHTVTVRWYQNGTYLNLNNDAATHQPLTPDHPNYNVYFVIHYPVPGVGTARIYWDRPDSDTDDTSADKYLAQTIYFSVDAPTPTAPPATAKPSGTTTQPGSTPTATK